MFIQIELGKQHDDNSNSNSYEGGPLKLKLNEQHLQPRQGIYYGMLR